MYAIQVKGQMKFLRKEGGYCGLTTPREIKWISYYLSATEEIQKLGSREELVVVEAADLLMVMAESLHRLSPEILSIVKELESHPLTDEELFLHIDTATRLAAMRGGMEEMRKRRDEDQARIAALEEQDRLQKLELEKLMAAMRDYEDLVKRTAGK